VAKVKDRKDRTGKCITLFPSDLPGKEWVQFEADGFSQPACGVVYRTEDTVSCGMALGGIDTGCLDLETSGLLGYCTIFNSHLPRRGPINLPILGLSTGGRTCVLSTKRTKKYEAAGKGIVTLFEPLFTDLNLEGVDTAREIHYWGHYPVVDLEYETDAPISVGMRAWAPFVPGDLKNSMIPGIVFEVHLRNTSQAEQKGTIAFSFPGPTKNEAGTERFIREKIKGNFNGVAVTTKQASYALGVIGKETLRLGGELGADGQAWSRIARQLPDEKKNQPGTSVAVDFSMAPGDKKVIRFVLTWHSPQWKSAGYPSATGMKPRSYVEYVPGLCNTFTHMYAKHYPDPVRTAKLLARIHESLLKRILAWQEVIYTEENHPVWLRDSLVNVLYTITECGLWAQTKPPLPEWVRPKDGLFGMNESPRCCPQIECVPCSFYGNQPLVYFFPELALSTLRGHKGYMCPDGMAAFMFGDWYDFATPEPGRYQLTTNGISLVAMIHRYWMCYKDKDFLKEFYPVVKLNTYYTMSLRPEYPVGDRIIAMPSIFNKDEREWFEAPEPGWFGMVAHVAGLHLAQLRIAQRMAEEVGDREAAKQFEEWFKAGSESMENKLWTGSYYLNFLEPETGKKSELVFGYQLDGEWITAHHGLSRVSREDRVRTVLQTIKRINMALSKTGAVNYANPDGTPANVGGYGTYAYFIPEALMLAMTYMYEGEREFGLEFAHKVWHNLVCVQGYTWDITIMVRGDVDTGERQPVGGFDYYQAMMLWSLPAALMGQDFSGPAKSGGLVHRVINAARRGHIRK